MYFCYYYLFLRSYLPPVDLNKITLIHANLIMDTHVLVEIGHGWAYDIQRCQSVPMQFRKFCPILNNFSATFSNYKY